MDIKFLGREPSSWPRTTPPNNKAAERRKLAKKLKDRPDEWALVSEGHASTESARSVRRRLQKYEEWAGFVFATDKAEDGTYSICAKFSPTD